MQSVNAAHSPRQSMGRSVRAPTARGGLVPGAQHIDDEEYAHDQTPDSFAAVGRQQRLGGNPLVNASFETGTFAGWTVSGASSGVNVSDTVIPGSDFESTVAAKDGSCAASGLVRGACCTDPESVTFSQTVSAAPGEDDSIGFYINNHSDRGVGYFVGNDTNRVLIFVNDVGLFGDSTHTACPADCLDPSRGWIGIGGTVNSGAATSLKVDLRVIASGLGRVGLSADDFYVVGSPVPEPGTMGLMAVALACLALHLRTRKHAQFARARQRPRLRRPGMDRTEFLAQRARAGEGGPPIW